MTKLRLRKSLVAQRVNKAMDLVEKAKWICVAEANRMRENGTPEEVIEAWITKQEHDTKSHFVKLLVASVPEIQAVMVEAITLPQPDDELIVECGEFLKCVDQWAGQWE